MSPLWEGEPNLGRRRSAGRRHKLYTWGDVLPLAERMASCGEKLMLRSEKPVRSGVAHILPNKLPDITVVDLLDESANIDHFDDDPLFDDQLFEDDPILDEIPL
jgi:hypothetical protein